MFLDPDPSLNSVHAELTACLSYRQLCYFFWGASVKLEASVVVLSFNLSAIYFIVLAVRFSYNVMTFTFYLNKG